MEDERDGTGAFVAEEQTECVASRGLETRTVCGPAWDGARVEVLIVSIV